MKQMPGWLRLFGLFFTALFLSACGAAQAPTTRDEVPRMTAEELKERMDNGEAIVIGDTRSQREYDLKHITGAISIPARLVEDHLQGLPRDQAIILYCT